MAQTSSDVDLSFEPIDESIDYDLITGLRPRPPSPGRREQRSTGLRSRPATPERRRTNLQSSEVQSNNRSSLNQLEAYGYRPVERVTIQTVEREPILEYLKVVNGRGQTSYIELDTSTELDSQYPTVVLSDDPKSEGLAVPYRIKMKALQCAGNMVHGIAFVGKEGLCVVRRDPESLSPRESNYVLTISTTQPEPYDLEIAYPVVRMSELIANESVVSRYIDMVTRKLRNETHQQCLQGLDEMKRTIGELEASYRRFCQQQQGIFEGIMRDFRILERIYDDYAQNPPTDQQEREKQSQVIYNLQHRHEVITQLLNIGQYVTTLRCQIQAKAHEFDELTSYLEREYREPVIGRDVANS